MLLKDAFRIHSGSRVAIVGAGGKTSAMFLIARQFPLSIISTSTHLLGGQGSMADQHLILGSDEDLNPDSIKIQSGVVLITGALDEAKFRFLAPSTEQLQMVVKLADDLEAPLFIEADGARHRSIKAPGEHEPAIPEFINSVVLVAGLSVFGKPLDDVQAHRPKIFGMLGGIKVGDLITSQSFVKVVNHPLGGLKNIPIGAERNLLLTQPNDQQAIQNGKEIAKGALGQWDTVALADTKDATGVVRSTRKMVSGIVLAAGASVRYGKVKIYEKYDGKTFLRRICETAASGLDEVIVVARSDDARAQAELAGLPIRLVYNDQPDAGQSRSIKIGLRNLSAKSGAVIFLHADQPQTSPMLINALVHEGSKTKAAIIAPFIDGRRGTPVYFDKTTYADLRVIEGDQGGKQIFHKHQLRYITWLDKKQLIDVDNPADLEKLNND